MNEQRYFILHRDSPLSWALMPYAIERIKKFCVDYGTDLNPEIVADLVQQNFISDSPKIMIIVGYQKDVGIFCHVMGVIDDITGNKFLTILQFKSDIPFDDKEQVAKMWKKLQAFGLKHGAKEAQLITASDKLVKVFDEKYGFKLHRYLMRKDLEE